MDEYFWLILVNANVSCVAKLAMHIILEFTPKTYVWTK